MSPSIHFTTQHLRILPPEMRGIQRYSPIDCRGPKGRNLNDIDRLARLAVRLVRKGAMRCAAKGRAMKKCHKCGQAWVSEKKQPAVKEYCEKCSAYLHCCLNCRFYEPKLHNQCAIPTTDWVGDKAGANFCDEYDFRDEEAQARDGGASASARNLLDSMFGEGEAKTDSDRLDAFKKFMGD